MNYKHGCAHQAERNKNNRKWSAYYRWSSMKQRCEDPNHKSYADYGGRGITYDPAWSEFRVFFADMGPPPVGTTMERIDNDGPYCKENCRWATRKDQSRNRRMNHYLEFNGERRIIVEWAEHLGVAPRLLRVRLNRGWSVERTLSTPVQA